MRLRASEGTKTTVWQWRYDFRLAPSVPFIEAHTDGCRVAECGRRPSGTPTLSTYDYKKWWRLAENKSVLKFAEAHREKETFGWHMHNEIESQEGFEERDEMNQITKGFRRSVLKTKKVSTAEDIGIRSCLTWWAAATSAARERSCKSMFTFGSTVNYWRFVKNWRARSPEDLAFWQFLAFPHHNFSFRQWKPLLRMDRSLSSQVIPIILSLIHTCCLPRKQSQIVIGVHLATALSRVMPAPWHTATPNLISLSRTNQATSDPSAVAHQNTFSCISFPNFFGRHGYVER